MGGRSLAAGELGRDYAESGHVALAGLSHGVHGRLHLHLRGAGQRRGPHLKIRQIGTEHIPQSFSSLLSLSLRVCACVVCVSC